MSLLNPFYKLKYPSSSPQLYFTTFFLNAPHKPILQVEVPNFFIQNYTSPLFEYPQHQAILFKRHFRTSSFLNVHPKPILQVEVPIHFTTTLLYNFRARHNIIQVFTSVPIFFVHATISCKFPLQFRFFSKRWKNLKYYSKFFIEDRKFKLSSEFY